MNDLSGSKFRDEIARILRLRYTGVNVEKRLQTTTADVFFIDNSNTLFCQKIAVEAKDWNKPLTSRDIATIGNLYRPSINSSEIDHLWIIGRHTLSSSPAQSIAKLTKVRYSTFDEFCSSLMNFTSLLKCNILTFEHDDASRNFIEARVHGKNNTMLAEVKSWLNSQRTGFLIYGGYGIVKTIFSYYLAKVLSEDYEAGRSSRVPIRIPLGGVYSKQDLIALICSNLSGGETSSCVPGFTFHLFLDANIAGQFILILDGFDEMRHAMDLEDFVYTFESLKPLFNGKAKVVVLGRPDSFLSLSDEQKVLSSLFERRADHEHELQKAEVAFFSKSEVETYLSNFISRRAQPLSERESLRYKAIIASLPDNEESILSRPIQLKMFTSIIDDCLDGGMDLTRYEIYDRFIYRFIKRELQKPARRTSEDNKEDSDSRAIFMQSVAWWIINIKKENRFLAAEIPTEAIPRDSKRKATSEAALREALVGSVIEKVSAQGVLDKKENRYYYFPHKSYIEFLVAQHFSNQKFNKEFNKDMYVSFLQNMNSEILSFVEEGPMSGIQNLRRGLQLMIGHVDYKLVEVCANKQDISEELVQHNSFGAPADIYVHYTYLIKKDLDPKQYLLRALVTPVLSVLWLQL